VRTENHGSAVRNFIQLFHEYRTLGAQVLDHETVVYHFVAHIDGRAEARQRLLDDFMARSTPAQKPRGWRELLACGAVSRNGRAL